MLSRIRGFISRHRRKFIITSVVAGGSYLLLRYVQRKLYELQERRAREIIEKSRRIQHFESTERTCNQVIIGMGTELCNAIIRECSTVELLEKLRQNGHNKLELWEEIKIVAFTRLAVFIYANSLLTVGLRVQVNLLGGYLYKDITSEQPQQITDATKQAYLSLMRHYINEGGLNELIRLITSKVNGIFKALPLNKRLKLPDIEQLFYALQMSINGDALDPNSHMAMYLLPAQLPQTGVPPLLERMYNETLDLLESDEASVVCAQNICRGFSLAVDAIAEAMPAAVQLNNKKPEEVKAANGTIEETAEAAQASAKQLEEEEEYNASNGKALLNINALELPLAKLIPIVNGLTARGFSSTTRPQNLATSLLTFYLVAEKTKVLGGNIYETFSS